MNTQVLVTIMQMILSFANICILAYAFVKFLNRPRDLIEDRVTTCEVQIKEIKESLKLGNDNFAEQDKTNSVLIHSIMALIEFEIQYCLTEKKPMSKDLEKAKDDLHEFLSKR